MRTFFVLFFAISSAALLFVSCDNSHKIKQLQEETEDIHDEAMRNLAVMNRVVRNFKKEIAQLDSIGSSTAIARKDSLLQVIGQMDKAEEDMMAWMAEYKAPDSLAPAAALSYLEDQYKKIVKNRDDIKAAMLAAEPVAR